ncbi:MAG: T9SS type A sorting domain-containing protein [Bacteroidales bacterium]|nr:T9SS type A sorting domain-containing protein [Bacteroidales bacterium]
MKKLLHVMLFISAFLSMIFCQSGNAQVNWIKSADNPVITPGGTWTSHGFPFIYLVDVNDTLRMWFTASDGDPVGSDRIGYGISADGITFDLMEAPVFEPAFGQGTFDSQGVFGASVWFDGESYKMWYNGYNSQPYYTGALRAGLATSADGINWTRYSEEPVLELGDPGDWDDTWAYVNTVLFEEGMYKMWYTGFDGAYTCIGYATSADGITWDKHPDNPVIEPGGSGFGGLDAAQNPRVIHSDAGYEMWFNGQYADPDFNVYYGTSSDGIEWSYSYEPVMMTGETGSFDSEWVWHPCVIFDEGVYRMWYSGYNGSGWSVGYATDSTLTGVGQRDGWTAGSPDLNIYPNPAYGNVDFTFYIPAGQHTSLTIYNLQGQPVATVLNRRLEAGEHRVRFDAGSMTAGIYCVVLEQDTPCQVSRKLVVGQ